MAISILSIIAFIFSAIIHEYAHGWVAHKLGDDTAKNAGRLTLNPVSHIDPFGSVILPLLMIMSKVGFVLGWAKPVPYNPSNLSDRKFGDAKVAIAGPISNFLVAIIFGMVVRFAPAAVSTKVDLINGFFYGQNDSLLELMHGSFVNSLVVVALIICFVNIILGLFNLIPVPPLDGSRVLTTFLSWEWQNRLAAFEQYGIFVLLILLFVGIFDFIWPTALFIFGLLVG